MSFWFGCWVVCVVVVLFFVFSGDTLIIVSPFLSYRGIANQTRCIDDRLSFERARHRPKKKKGRKKRKQGEDNARVG